MPLGEFGIYITNYSNNKTIELPVNPAEVLIKYETDDTSQTILNLGEINRLGDVKLTSVSIESTFPKAETHYLASELKKPDTYINFLKNIQKKKQHVQFVVASTKISLTMTISSFEYGFKNGYDGEYTYTLQLKEYKEYKYKKITKTKKASSKKTKPAPAKKIGVGSIVYVNGRLHRDSYGSGPGVYEKNAKRKITYMAPGRAYPVHVALVNGGPRGWVKKSEVKLA